MAKTKLFDVVCSTCGQRWHGTTACPRRMRYVTKQGWKEVVVPHFADAFRLAAKKKVTEFELQFSDGGNWFTDAVVEAHAHPTQVRDMYNAIDRTLLAAEKLELASLLLSGASAPNVPGVETRLADAALEMRNEGNVLYGQYEKHHAQEKV